MKRTCWSVALAALFAGIGPVATAQEEGLPLPETEYEVETDPATGEQRVRLKTSMVVDVVAGMPAPVPLDVAPIRSTLDLSPPVGAGPDEQQVVEAILAGDRARLEQLLPAGAVDDAAFQVVRDELQRVAGTAATDPHGVAGSYTMQRSGYEPFAVRIAARADGAYDVTRESGVYRTGVGRWKAEDHTLEVEFPRLRAGGFSDALDGQAEAARGSDRVRYRIQTVTGRIEGDGAKGWRDGSVTPIAGWYVLSGWQARSVVELWVSEREDGTLSVRRVSRAAAAPDGPAAVLLGEGTLKGKNGRTLAVSFGRDLPEIEYRIREDGRIEGNYFARTPRGFEGRYEEGWRNGVERPQLPGLLARTWKGLKRLLAAPAPAGR